MENERIVSVKKIAQLVIASIIIISCKEKVQEKFSLKGVTTGIDNGTTIYLRHDNIIIDSTYINDNSFVFDARRVVSPIQINLITKDFSNYRFI